MATTDPWYDVGDNTIIIKIYILTCFTVHTTNETAFQLFLFLVLVYLLHSHCGDKKNKLNKNYI